MHSALRTEEFSGPQLRTVINAVQVVRNELLVVTTAADETSPWARPAPGFPCLREAVALAPAGAGIVFDPAVFTPASHTITLTSEITLPKSVTIDASNLPGGVTINGGPGSNRICTVNSGPTVALRGLTPPTAAAPGLWPAASAGRFSTTSTPR